MSFVPFKDPTPHEHHRIPKYLSEFVGTYFLTVTVGCNVLTSSIGAALSIGATLMAMTYSLASVSGAHFNPAVTLAHTLAGGEHVNIKQMSCYVLAQALGGLLGAFTYYGIFSEAFRLHPITAYSVHDAVLVEMLYTMALCYVVLHLTCPPWEHWHTKALRKQSADAAGLTIGLVVTAAVVAVGPISGCSLNPAVSFGALWASKLAYGPQETGLWALYILSPLGGGVLGAIGFYFSHPIEPPLSPPASPNLIAPPIHRQPYLKKGTINLKRNEVFVIPEEVEAHKIAFGMSWECDSVGDGADIDCSCVKFGADGKMLEGIYFSNRFGREDKRSGSTSEGIVVHTGDNATGCGTGFGMSIGPFTKKKKGQAVEETDCERIEVRQLKRLRQFQPKATYLFFVVNVFSAEFKFEHLKDLRLRLIDLDDNSYEICRFEKTEKLGDGNGFVLGVLFWRDGQWIFKIVDDAVHIKEHGTFRNFEPHLAAIVQKLEGAPIRFVP